MIGLLLCADVASAVPRPLVLPDLRLRTELQLSASYGGSPTLDFAGALAVDGRTPVGTTGELFVRWAGYDAGGRGGTRISLDRPRLDSDLTTSFAITNLRLGARRILTSSDRQWTAAATAWTWIPFGTGSSWLFTDTAFARPGHADLLMGLADPEATFDGVGFGAAADARWSGSTTFVQAEIGTIVVRDFARLDLDDVVGAIGAGTGVLGHATLAGEVRVVQHPTGANVGAGERDWAFSLGITNGGNRWMNMRLRVGAAFGGDVHAALIGVDALLH